MNEILQSHDDWAAVICIVSFGFSSVLIPTNALIMIAENDVNCPKFKVIIFFAVAPKIFGGFQPTFNGTNEEEKVLKNPIKLNFSNKFRLNLDFYLRKNATKWTNFLDAWTIVHGPAQLKPFPWAIHIYEKYKIIMPLM